MCSRCFALCVLVSLVCTDRSQAYEAILSYYRMEEGELGDIIDWLYPEGAPAGMHDAAYSADVAFEQIPATCEPNSFSLSFDGDSVATFMGTFPFHTPAEPPAPEPVQEGAGAGYYYEDTGLSLEFWLKVTVSQESSILWTETAGEEVNRFDIYLTPTEGGVGIGGEYKDAEGTMHPISQGTHELALDVWTHVTVVRDEVVLEESIEHSYTWHFDGAADDSLTAFDRSVALPSGGGWTIGGRPGMPFRGLIDELRFVSGPIEFLVSGAGFDCNANGVVDRCDFVNGTSLDCNGNGIPDECDISEGTSTDCDDNGIPDDCEIAELAARDCNLNGILDACDVASGTSEDCDEDGRPDECFFDCNGNGLSDACEIAEGTATDCDGNGIPDECGKGIDLSAWSQESYPLTDPEASGAWNRGDDPLSVVFSGSAAPSLLVSESLMSGRTFRVRVETLERTSEMDAIGFAVGFNPGDATNPDADYLLIDWSRGLAVSRVSGIPSAEEFSQHVNLGTPGAGLENGLEELAVGINLRSTHLQAEREYAFEIEFTASSLKVYVDGALDLSISGSFREGPVAFYVLGQPAVRFRAVTDWPGEPCIETAFLRGDCDSDGFLGGTVNDIVYLASWAFLGGPDPLCAAACDADADGFVGGNVNDIVYLANWAFLGGPSPAPPFPSCAVSTRIEDDALGCRQTQCP